MPRRKSSGGGSVADAFAARFGAVGPVKMTYLGKDRHGASIYKFTYQSRKGTGAASQTRGKGAQPGTVTATRTFAIVRNGSAWGFVSPNSAASNTNQIADPSDVSFDRASNELQQRALVKIGELVASGAMSVESARLMAQAVPNMGETALKQLINRKANVSQNFVGGPWYNTGEGMVQEIGPVGSAQENLDDIFSGIDFGGGGGGGGGGFAGPVYRKPDERVVEDIVKGGLVSLVGTVHEHLLGPGIERFMRDHRRNFDSPTAEIDPNQSVLEFIRSSHEYQSVHKLRPKSVDERDWISQRAQEAQRGGLDTAQIEDFAIQQATIGGDLPDVAEAAATRQFQRTGQAPAILDQQFRQVATAMFSRVAR